MRVLRQKAREQLLKGLAQAAATGMTDVLQAGADSVNTLDLDEEASSHSEREASCSISNGSPKSRASHVARIPGHTRNYY